MKGSRFFGLAAVVVFISALGLAGCGDFAKSATQATKGPIALDFTDREANLEEDKVPLAAGDHNSPVAFWLEDGTTLRVYRGTGDGPCEEEPADLRFDGVDTYTLEVKLKENEEDICLLIGRTRVTDLKNVPKPAQGLGQLSIEGGNTLKTTVDITDGPPEI
ncbi:MAG: hypothetical protein Q4G30_10600 [Actinomycetaceae bacterium]|nr:hypothetical protein [Actinomycetaceae bacterium]